MTNLSLRLMIFLMFCLLTFGAVVVILTALFLGFRQLGDPDAVSPFVTSATIGVFGVAGLVVLVWLLFDEKLSKPIERLAAVLRLQAHAGVASKIDPESARYLGDLAPAASAIQQKLNDETQATSKIVALETAKLHHQRDQLLRILSDIPIAVIVANPDHQIVLYDGQAAALMENEAPARLNGSVFDYLEKDTIEKMLDLLAVQNKRRLPIMVKGHRGTVYSGHIRLFGAKDGYTLMLEPLDPDAERPLVFDFDLLNSKFCPDLNDVPLRDLNFVVFDSETTGLDPDKDEVVQLGAVRVVNGRIVPGEVFETLVNPGMPIPAQSSRIHRINDRMVMDAPRFDHACRAFHHFAKGSIIVAHNAPFDMAFLRRQAKEIDLRFEHPIVDTVHLSAILFGGSSGHTLDALCARLGVSVPPEIRHTATGDARATAQALVAMLPILEGRGIGTFGALRSKIKKQTRILTADA